MESKLKPSASTSNHPGSSENSTNFPESIPQYVQYMQEFNYIEKTFNANNVDELRKKAIEGDLKSSNFRSIYWMLFLRILKEGDGEWIDQKLRQRTEYQKAKNNIVQNPHESSEPEDNPLSQETNSSWNKHFCDNELKTVIRQDVIRAFPHIEYFRKPDVQKMMENILFIYARLNPSLVYRQGMHEVLGMVLFVIQNDHQAMLLVHKQSKENISTELAFLMDSDYFEHDAFEIFDKIMLHIESYYQMDNIKPLATGHFPNVPSSDQAQSSTLKDPNKEVLVDLEKIKQEILLKYDPELYDYLYLNEIPLSFFGIKWLRLLFVREFAIEEVFLLWDAIFAEDTQLMIIGSVLVAMLMAIRSRILKSDHTTALAMIMKYPTNVDINIIIRHALHIKSPEKYPIPLGASVVQAKYKSKVEKRQELVQVGSSKTLPRSRSISKQALHHLISFERVNGLRRQTAINALNSAAQRHHLDVDSPIVDGYRLNDPDITALEYNHIHGLLVVTRSKLIRYVGVLRRHFPQNESDELHQVVNGLEELCSLLRPLDPNVERALEANEVSPQQTSQKKSHISQHENTKMLRVGGFKEVEMHQIKSVPVTLELTTSNNNNNNKSLPIVDPTNQRDDSNSD